MKIKMSQDAKTQAQLLAGPEYFDCRRLSARISARQCLLNQGKADYLRPWGLDYVGHLWVCLNCALGREMQVYPPSSELGQPKERTALSCGDACDPGR